MKNKHGIEVEESPVVEGLSPQEQDYINDIAAAATGYLDSLNQIQKTLKNVFEANPLDTQLANFQNTVMNNREIAEKLFNWADTNQKMNYFPANHSELNAAKGLAEEGSGQAWYLREGYRNLVASTSHLDSFTSVAAHITRIRITNERLYNLLFRAEKAVSREDQSVDGSLLNLLPLPDDK